MILHKMVKIEKYVYSYDSIEEFEKHKKSMEDEGFISDPYLHVWSENIVQYCSYEREIRNEYKS